MSTNHQYIQFSDDVVKRFEKTVPFILSGYRLNPHNPSEQINFVLQTDESCFDFTSKKKIKSDYEHDVIELYSDKEVKMFLRLNRSIIERGYLKEYAGSPEQINTDNLVNDTEIQEIASIKTPNMLKSRLKTITSHIVIQRCLDAAIQLNRPYSIIKLLEAKLEELKQVV